MSDDCTILIPTLARADRADTLARAIASVRTGNQAGIRIVVVVNGAAFDAGLVDDLRARSDLDLLQIETPSLSAALRAGRHAVQTPYFGFLDDDDEYLPGSVDARIAQLERAPGASLIACNGYRHLEGVDTIAMRQLALVAQDPLRALFRENWLSSCGGLYRTAMVPLQHFDDIARYLEWSWLAFDLAVAGHQVITSETPAFRIHDSVGSESKSAAYVAAQPGIYERMLRHCRRADIRQLILSRQIQAWHAASVSALEHGQHSEAWRLHWLSLQRPGGWKFMPYTRHLIAAGVRR